MKENKIIDQIAKDALANYEMPYEPMQWHRLEQELNAQHTSASANTVWVVKGIEILLMVTTMLFLVYFTQKNAVVLDTPYIAVPLSKVVETPKTMAALAENNTVNLLQSTTIVRENAKTAIAQTATLGNTADMPAADLPLLRANNKPISFDNKVHIANNNTQNTALPDDETIIIEALPSLVHPTGAHVATNAATIDNIAAEDAANMAEKAINETKEAYLPAADRLQSIETLAPRPLQTLPIPTELPKLSLNRVLPMASNDDAYETARLRYRPLLKSSAGYEWNSIEQHSVEGLKKAPGQSTRFGLGMVFNVFRNIGVETGVEVTHKKYETSDQVRYFLNSNNNQVLQTTTILLAELPVSVNVKLLQKPRYMLYAKVGTRFSTLLTAAYQWRNGTDAVYNTYNASLSSKLRINGAQYEEITQSVNFWSVGGGVGMAYHLTPRVNVFVEPTLYHALNGIGQREDYINSLCLAFGASCAL